MIDRDWLSSVIAAQHLEAGAIADCAARFESHPAKVLVVPSFLKVETAARVADFLEQEAEWTPRKKLQRDRHSSQYTSEEDWAATSDVEWFFRFSTGQVPPGRINAGIATYIRLQKAFGDPRMVRFFEAMTGTRLRGLSLTMHAMGAGDFLRPHDDRIEGRRLAFILYLTRDWRPELGGQLCIQSRDREVFTLEPEYNSLVVFDVSSHISHWVETVNPSAGTLQRRSLGGWYGAGTEQD